MSESGRPKRPPVHERRRQHFPTPENAKPDDEAKEVGRRGIAKAREELDRHRRPRR